jgi:hypothetical protein
VGQRIKVEVDGVSAVAETLDDLSPKMAKAFIESLPIETRLRHGKWSGRACFFEVETGPMSEVGVLEHPITWIYPGTFVAREEGDEILVAYGQAESRWGLGPKSVTPVAQLVENRQAFLDALERMHDEGDKRISFRQEG